MAATAIGLTGAFGAGCTTAALHLRDQRGFKVIRLSDVLRKMWHEKHSEAPPRLDLQRLGDELRQARGTGILVDLAVANETAEKLVFDGIRNVAEIERLLELYGHRFTLIGILSSADARWRRIGSTAYLNGGLSQQDFLQDDARDRNEETPWGQQVELCVDQADVLIDNSENATLNAFQDTVIDYADLVTGVKPGSARPEEILMHMAYAASHSSKCLKRHVGSVVVDSTGQTVAVGYNENPLTTKPCAEEPAYGRRCFRDIVRNAHFKNLSELGGRCPKCGQIFPVIEGPPWRCPTCAEKGIKTNLEAHFFPDRAMNWCTAIHAEAWALAAAGERARGGTIYTTTFPCMQCSEKIIQAGIKTVWYTEAYPDPHSAARLALGEITTRRFQGVRSAIFERVFGRTKPGKTPSRFTDSG